MTSHGTNSVISADDYYFDHNDVMCPGRSLHKRMVFAHWLARSLKFNMVRFWASYAIFYVHVRVYISLRTP